jgi:hypothetical protein
VTVSQCPHIPNGTMCYPCVIAHEHKLIMGGATQFEGYPSADGKYLGAWCGGVLARILARRTYRVGSSPNGAVYQNVHVTAVTADGRYWWGTYNVNGSNSAIMRAYSASDQRA